MSEIISIIPSLQKKKFLGFSLTTYTLIVTKNETIFAKLTSEMLKEISKKAREEAKKEGKGFFGQWGNQLSAFFNYSEKYLKMSIEDIKKETKGNFSINNDSITKVKIILYDQHDTGRVFYDIILYESGQKHKFFTEHDLKKQFKEAYGSKIC